MGHHANVSHPSFFPVFNADTFTITHCPPDQGGTIHQGSRRGAIRRILSEISYVGASQPRAIKNPMFCFSERISGHSSGCRILDDVLLSSCRNLHVSGNKNFAPTSSSSSQPRPGSGDTEESRFSFENLHEQVIIGYGAVTQL